jgi:hypothetical protein
MANTLALKAVYDPGSGPALQTISATDKLYWQKTGAFAYGATGAIPVGTWNDKFHIIDSGNAELCDTADAVNLKYIASGTVAIAGGGTVNLNTVTTAQCLNLLASCSPNAEITAASFFVYGATEADVPAGCSIYGFEQGDAAWDTTIAGSAAAHDLGASGSAATHNYYVGLSIMPTTNGAITGTLKFSVTFV